jgi:hypothetical protein
MFERLAKWILPVAAEAGVAGATGGVSVGFQILGWVIRHLPEIILTTALLIILGMYGCEKSKVKDLTADKTKLEETVKAKDIEIAKQAEEIAFQKDLVAKRTAELGITKAALDKQGAVEAETEETKKAKDDLLDKWANEQDPKKRAEYEAAYWNTVLGIKTSIDKKTNEVKLLGPMKPIKPVKPIGGGR